MSGPTTVHGVPVFGVDVDPETRCAHYRTDRDVVAIRFACCGRYYPCHACHEELTDHEHEVWGPEAFDEEAVLCGVCGTELPISAYLDADDACPNCGVGFNPGCAAHAHRYFGTCESGSDGC